MGTDRRDTRKRIYSMIALLLSVVVMFVALVGMLHAGRKKIDESVYKKPSETLKALAKAENRFRSGDMDKNGKRDYASTFEALERAGCITKRLASGRVGGYRYEILHADQSRWSMRASPVEITSQTLFYYIDQSHIIRARRMEPADAKSDVYWHPFRGMEWSGGGS